MAKAAPTTSTSGTPSVPHRNRNLRNYMELRTIRYVTGTDPREYREDPPDEAHFAPLACIRTITPAADMTLQGEDDPVKTCMVHVELATSASAYRVVGSARGKAEEVERHYAAVAAANRTPSGS